MLTINHLTFALDALIPTFTKDQDNQAVTNEEKKAEILAKYFINFEATIRFILEKYEL